MWYFSLTFSRFACTNIALPYASRRLILSFAWAPSDSFIHSLWVRYLFSNSMMINVYMSWGTHWRWSVRNYRHPSCLAKKKIPPSHRFNAICINPIKHWILTLGMRIVQRPSVCVCIIFWLACKWCVAQPPRLIYTDECKSLQIFLNRLLVYAFSIVFIVPTIR